jgi:hypothetical protein
MSEDWRVGRVNDIAALIKKAVPEVVEERKWRKPSNPDGVPAFSLDGLICVGGDPEGEGEDQLPPGCVDQ